MGNRQTFLYHYMAIKTDGVTRGANCLQPDGWLARPIDPETGKSAPPGLRGIGKATSVNQLADAHRREIASKESCSDRTANRHR